MFIIGCLQLINQYCYVVYFAQTVPPLMAVPHHLQIPSLLQDQHVGSSTTSNSKNVYLPVRCAFHPHSTIIELAIGV